MKSYRNLYMLLLSMYIIVCGCCEDRTNSELGEVHKNPIAPYDESDFDITSESFLYLNPNSDSDLKNILLKEDTSKILELGFSPNNCTDLGFSYISGLDNVVILDLFCEFKQENIMNYYDTLLFTPQFIPLFTPTRTYYEIDCIIKMKSLKVIYIWHNSLTDKQRKLLETHIHSSNIHENVNSL